MHTFKVPDLLPVKDKKETPALRDKTDDEIPAVEESAPTKAKDVEIPVEGSAPTSVKDAEIPYKEPKWSMKPTSEEIVYKFEVLKSGQIIEEHENLQTKPFWIFGRLPQNDIVMEHPTISRFHAVLQYRPKIINEEDNEELEKSPEEGWYIYDLESTHGTFINKQRVPPKVYIRIRVGHMLTLGLSTRKLILYGPGEDEEPESELTVTELKDRRIKEIEAQKEKEKMQEKEREKEGISWGMADDAEEESDLSVNPYSTTTNEELFLDDPKKTLRGYFEREGHDLEYKCDEISGGSFVCKVELPLDDGNGRSIVAEVTHKGRKKDCVLQCALEACRILDRHGVLRQSHHDPQKRKANDWKNDSDDDDEFYDRTSITKEKKQRLSNAKEEKAVLSNENLQGELDKIVEKIKDIDKEIADYNERFKAFKANKEKLNESDLDDFMDNLNAEVADFDTNQIRVLRKQKFECMEQKKFFERAIKKTGGGPNLLKKFGIKKPKPAAPVRIPEPMVEEEFKPEVESDDEEDVKIDKKAQENKEDVNMDKKTQENKESIKEEPSSKECSVSESITCFPTEPEKEQDSAKLDQSIVELNDLTENKSEFSAKLQLKPDEIPIIKSPEIIKSTELPETSEKSPTKKSSRHKKNKKSKNKGNRLEVDIDDVGERDDQYVGWVPPKNQSGDGRSSLNDKFGY